MDFSAELYDINAWVALYTGFYLAVALKYLLLWTIEKNPMSIADRLSQPKGIRISADFFKNRRLGQNVIVMWLGKYIRIKYCPTEDPDSSPSFLNR